jgi:hypothetical protein
MPPAALSALLAMQATRQNCVLRSRARLLVARRATACFRSATCSVSRTPVVSLRRCRSEQPSCSHVLFAAGRVRQCPVFRDPVAHGLRYERISKTNRCSGRRPRRAGTLPRRGKVKDVPQCRPRHRIVPLSAAKRAAGHPARRNGRRRKRRAVRRCRNCEDASRHDR